MTTATQPKGVLEEIADLLALEPTAEQILQFRPSPQLQARAQDLATKSKDGMLSDVDRRELDQFLHAEYLMRLTKRLMQAGRYPR